MINTEGFLSCDTEATGLDLYHESRPFFVTFADNDLQNFYYEWRVNPLTREVEVNQNDIEDIVNEIDSAAGIVFHNAKFDVTALSTVLPPDFAWPWHKTWDTLLSGHLLASNHPHDLTSMVLEFLRRDISKYEDRMKVVVKACRSIVDAKGSMVGKWQIARKHGKGMPSAEKECWKADMWLVRELLDWCKRTKKTKLLPDKWRDWENVVTEYAASDSISTMALFKRTCQMIEARGLWEIYLERIKVLKPAYETESFGVTYSNNRLSQLYEEYQQESELLGKGCVSIGENYGHELKLPKSGNNKSITELVFDKMEVPAIKRSKKTGEPSLDAKVLDRYIAGEEDLPPDQVEFMTLLKNKRSRDTAITYMNSYRRFGLEHEAGGEWMVLHPNLNPTGTDTLRWSSNNPNEQNISKKKGFNLRYNFGPAPGREWWSLDAKNQELRIPAYESGEQELINLFERSDEPPYFGSNHLLNFHTVYPEIWVPAYEKYGELEVGAFCKSEYAATYYQWCKNGGFAVQYGAMERDDGEGTADIAFHKEGAHALLKKRFKNLEKLNQWCIHQAETTGTICTLPDRTVNPEQGYPLLAARNQWGQVRPTTPLNYRVQGTACWVLMRAMIKVQNYLDQLNRRAGEKLYFIVMQIHDELVLDFPYLPRKGNLPKVKMVQKLMGNLGYDLVPSIPLPIGIEYHPFTWSESEVVA